MSDLADAHGTIRTFDEWAERKGDRLAVELTDDASAAKVDNRSAALGVLRERIAAAALDALIGVGDDQGEHLGPTNLPPIVIHHGAELINTPCPSRRRHAAAAAHP